MVIHKLLTRSGLILVIVFFSFLPGSCSKDDDHPVQHSFNYKMNNKQGGSTAHNEMSLANMFLLDNGFTAQNDGNIYLVIYATMGSGCGEAGKPNCYDATLVIPGLTVGTYVLGQNKPGNLQIAEFTASGIEQYSCNVGSPAGDVITVTITEVGGIGGVVIGSFTGSVGGIPLSGDFKVEKLS